MVAKSIHHKNGRGTDKQKDLLRLVAKTMHLSKGEADLLFMFCSMQDGFSPSSAILMRRTSMSHGGVYKARTALNKLGIIGETPSLIVIDWERIRLLSALDQRMTNRSAYVAPVISVTSSTQGGEDWRVRTPKEYGSKIDFFAYAPEETVIEFFRTHTEPEYEDVCGYIKNALAR